MSLLSNQTQGNKTNSNTNQCKLIVRESKFQLESNPNAKLNYRQKKT